MTDIHQPVTDHAYECGHPENNYAPVDLTLAEATHVAAGTVDFRQFQLTCTGMARCGASPRTCIHEGVSEYVAKYPKASVL